MANSEYRISINLSAIQPSGTEISHDRTHEGGRTLCVEGTINGSSLIRDLEDRLTTYPGERNGVSYTVSIRRLGDYPSDMTDLGTVSIVENLDVPDTIYAEDLKQIIEEILES